METAKRFARCDVLIGDGGDEEFSCGIKVMTPIVHDVFKVWSAFVAKLHGEWYKGNSMLMKELDSVIPRFKTRHVEDVGNETVQFLP